MQHLLMNLYRVFSYDAPGVKIGSSPGGVTNLNIGTKKAKFKFFFSESGRSRGLIFGM